MRKLVVLSFITLDGEVQAPGGPDEDPTGGFEHGGQARALQGSGKATIGERSICVLRFQRNHA